MIENCLISDRHLVDYLKKKLDDIKFIGFSKSLQTKELVKGLSGEIALEPRDKLLDIWKNLLGDAIVFLKGKDERETHHDEEIYGVDSLCKYFEKLQHFEGVLFGTVPYYRDHVTHTLRVFLLGEYVIKEAIGFENVDSDDAFLGEERRISADEKEAVWAIIALCHDLGYPLESIRSLSESARDMLQQFGRLSVQELTYGLSPQFHTISEFVLRFIGSSLERTDKSDEFAVHVQPKYFIKFANALDEYDHGVMSCLVLMKKLVYFLESDFTTDSLKFLDEMDARQYLIRRTILRAIASHDCEEIYHLKINNFPFLLLVCDEMQEWSRPRLVDVFRRSIPSSKLTINKLDQKNVSYEIEFYCENPIESDITEDIKNYFERKKRKFIKVLRSAVGGEYRDLHLFFRVVDKTTPTVKKYELDHERPDRVKDD